jgi:hypothetical protein
MKLFWLLVCTGWIVPTFYAAYLRKRLETVLLLLEEERKLRKQR